MMKLLATAAAAALVTSMAVAQPSTAPTANTFRNAQDINHLRASKMIGSAVYGPNNTNIGNINEVLIDRKGETQTVVIGVGGFLGVGEKDVGVPISMLQITPTQNGDNIQKISTTFTKEQLEKAPTFKWADQRR